MKTGKMMAANMVLAVLMVAASNAALVKPSISSMDGGLVANGTFATDNNGLTSLTDQMVGATSGSNARNGGYINTNGVSIANAMGEYTLQVYVGNNGVTGFDWNDDSRIGFFINGTVTTSTSSAGLTTAIDTFFNDADVTYSVGAPATAQTTPAEDTWELWTYTFTVANNGGGIYGSDLQFAARFDINAGGNFFIDNISELVLPLSAQVVGTGDVQLGWSAHADADSYNVYRSETSGSYGAPLTTISGTNFTDTTTSLFTTYFYQVGAVSNGVEFVFTTEDSVFTVDTTDTTPPAAPNPSVQVYGSRIVLDWADNVESDFASYSVYSSTVNGGPYSLVASGLTNSLYRDNGVQFGTTNYYAVTAVDLSGNESASNVVMGVPEAPTGFGSVFMVMTNGTIYGFDSLDGDGGISVAGQAKLTNGIPVATHAAYGTYQDFLATPEGTIYGVSAAGDVVSWSNVTDWVAGSASNTLSTGAIVHPMNGAGYNIASNRFYAVHSQNPYQGDIIDYATVSDFVNGVIDPNLVFEKNYNSIAMTSSYVGSDTDVQYFHVNGAGGLQGYASTDDYRSGLDSLTVLDVAGSGDEVAAGFALLQTTASFIGNVAVNVAGGNVVVSWTGQANAGYTLQARDSNSLVTGSWTDVGSVTSPSSSTVSVTNSIVGDKQFYRVVSP